MTDVLVTDAQMRSSLAVIRSLGKKGLDVTGAESTRFATGFFSKYCSERKVYPDPSKHPENFVSSLLDVVSKKDYRVIFPVTDVTAMLLVKNKEEFSKHTLVPLPDYEVFMRAMDKAETIRIAQDNGVLCPRTWVIDNIDESSLACDSLPYPVVIKPRIASGSRGITVCQSSHELRLKFPKVVAAYGPCLIQEYIPSGGEELGVYVLFNYDSKMRAVTVQKRLRSYPISGGPSTLRETVKKPELIEIADRLLRALGWWGVAMVEFRVDPRDGQPKLMEVNPRWWGSLQLSILSGIDFPYLLYKLVTEGDVSPIFNYQEGVKCRWLLPGDILWFLYSDHKLRNLPKLLRYERNDDIISLRDFGPTMGFLLATMRFAFSKDMWDFVLRKPIK